MQQKNHVAHKNRVENKARIVSKGLISECFFGADGRLAKKIERQNKTSKEYTYHFDNKGHLLRVVCNGELAEQYEYNSMGQRSEQRRKYMGMSDSTEGLLQYDTKGRVVRAGDTRYGYDKRGALTERSNSHGITKFFYGNDTMLDRVILDSGEEIRYEYDRANPLGPARRFKSGSLTAEYIWLDPVRLAAFLDHETQLEYTFHYNAHGLLDKIRILPMSTLNSATAHRKPDENPYTADWLNLLATQDRRARVQKMFQAQLQQSDFYCGYDQVGTLKILTDASGVTIKEVEYDSYGVKRSDTQPDIFLPIGFAGGLVDRDTGLVRFGYRDYDPAVGRFTAPDPAKDLRGDGDVYDYCVDDPVSKRDTFGLRFTPLVDGMPANEAQQSREPSGTETLFGKTLTPQKNTNALQPSYDDVIKKAFAQTGLPTESSEQKSRQWHEQIQQELKKGAEEAQRKKDKVVTISAVPKAPAPYPPSQKLTPFEALAVEKNYADRTTLPQYVKIASGTALNAGHSKGFSTRELKGNKEILVYLKNTNPLGAAMTVEAGSSVYKSTKQPALLFPVRGEALLRFKSRDDLTQFLSIDSNADSFSVYYEIYTRKNYDKR